MRAVGVEADAFALLAVEVAADVGTAFDDEDVFSGSAGFVGKDSAEEAAADDEEIIHGDRSFCGNEGDVLFSIS